MNKFALIALAGALLLPAAALAQDSSSGATACYELYQPVCAAHQVQCFAAPCFPVYETYSNSCFADNASATILHQGACTATETGPIKPTSPEPYTPPPGCIAWYDGCNSCGKSGDGAICTQRACLVQGAGYCTAYATTTPPVTTHPHPVEPATTTPPATATSTPLAHPHIFLRFWHWLSNLFN